MEIKSRKGFTAIADAMIFIMLMTVAFSVIFIATDSEPETQEASDILTVLMDSDTEVHIEGNPHVMKMYAALIINTKYGCGADTAAKNILDSHFGRDGAYLLTVESDGGFLSVGTGSGIPVSSYTKTAAFEYGSGTFTLYLY